MIRACDILFGMDYASEFTMFVQESEPDKPGDNTASSGSSKTHHGLSNSTMRAFVKRWSTAHPNLSYDDWQSTMASLYGGRSVDEVCLAGFLLERYPRFRKQLPLLMLREWVGHLQGWREIDTTCQSNFTAGELFERWDEWRPFLHDLSESSAIQHRRASLVLLVKPLRDSSDDRFLDAALGNVERLKREPHILITKAVSWVLRQAIKHHRQPVSIYVNEHSESLPAVAVREFGKKVSAHR